jgi:pimeloyl-ACP methyl ester carboxylesterase
MWILRLILDLLVILVLFLLFGCTGDPDRGELILAGIPSPSLAGSLLENSGRQPAMVYLPAAYRAGGDPFPVLYYLPGFTTDVTEYLDQSFQGMNLRITMDEMIRLGRIRPMIVVVVNGRNDLGGSFYVNSPVTGRWEDFVVRDVVGYVDATWRTFPEAGARGLAGDSMGGFGAVNLALKHPDIFGSVYAMSPGLAARDGVIREWLMADEEQVRGDLSAIQGLRSLPESEARERIPQLIESLYAERTLKSTLHGFLFAYAAAFAPDPAAGPPWINYPFEVRDGELEVVPEAMHRYDGGFGALEEKVAAYVAQPARLRAIALDYGRADRFGWIPEGTERLAALLGEAGIDCDVRPHRGSHIGSLRFRFEYELLPFFSKTFVFPDGATPSVRSALGESPVTSQFTWEDPT